MDQNNKKVISRICFVELYSKAQREVNIKYRSTEEEVKLKNQFLRHNDNQIVYVV